MDNRDTSNTLDSTCTFGVAGTAIGDVSPSSVLPSLVCEKATDKIGY
jgi:hypothetical protein